MTTPVGRHERHRHTKKINARRLTLVLTLLFVGGLVLWALIYSIINPSPHGAEKHVQPSTSAPAPTHAKPATTHTAPPPARTAPVKPKPPVHAVTPTPSHPLAVHYTVKLGDNLSSIASMYRLRSYVPLYDANKAAIGNNPNLIHVGLKLTVPSRK
jgi:nucleoid-associated protein YgaU